MSGKQSEILRWKNLNGPNSDLLYAAHTESGPNIFWYRRYQWIIISYYYTTKLFYTFYSPNYKFANWKHCKPKVGFESLGDFLLSPLIKMPQSKLSWLFIDNMNWKGTKITFERGDLCRNNSRQKSSLEWQKQIWAGADLPSLVDWGFRPL